MASSVISNQNLTNFNVINAGVSSSAVMQALTPAAFQTVQFNTLVNPVPAVAFSGTGNFSNETTLATNSYVYTLTAEDLVQAACTYEVFWAPGTVANSTTGIPLGTPAGATNLNVALGQDTAANGAALVSLFNLSPANPFVTCSFYQYEQYNAVGGAQLSVGLYSYAQAAVPTATGVYINIPSTGLFNNSAVTQCEVTPIRFEYNGASNVNARVLPSLTGGNGLL